VFNAFRLKKRYVYINIFKIPFRADIEIYDDISNWLPTTAAMDRENKFVVDPQSVENQDLLVDAVMTRT